jgi:hypothetical protein
MENSLKKILTGSLILITLVVGWRILFYKQESERLLEVAYKEKKKHPEIKTFDGFLEPEIPGKGNDEGLYGIDSNNNKIRDDIEIWINRTFNNRDERMVARQYAMDLNYKLYAAEKNQGEIIGHSASVAYTTAVCLNYIFNFKKGSGVMESLALLTYNTTDRKNILDNFENFPYSIRSVVDGMLLGQAYKGCNFKIDNEKELIQRDIETHNAFIKRLKDSELNRSK